MTCMDIINKLKGADRVRSWQLFTKLSRVFFVNDGNLENTVAELKQNASELNSIFIRNGSVEYFDVQLNDSEFVELIKAEMIEIKHGKKLDD